MRWEQRPVEIANLLNPAFCAVLLRDAIAAYSKKDKQGMNYLLVYLILPLVLHKTTRRSIPSRGNMTLIEWIEKHETNNWVFVDHIRQLIPFSKEALIFAIQQGVVAFGNQENSYGNLLALPKELLADETWAQNSVPMDCRNKARIVGEWFADMADITTIYRAFGIRP